ncbi:hypothetical protein [Gordonia zhaorongruii]|uniref:Rv0361 family membrane protein n=1 Tax=Gordonia zhaorongruii TaxID=2597659 RepID=UPI001F1A8070|nr:hypothetical protein [Gordonia zhaorongruii]
MSAKRPDDAGQESDGNESTEGSSAAEISSAPRSWRDLLPFIIAVSVAVVILAAIGISHLVRPSEERVSEDAKIQYVVNDMYSARNALNYEMYRGAHCEKDLAAKDFPSARQFADTNRVENEANGQLVVPSMDVETTGDRASVTVHEHRERDEQKKLTTDLTLIKQGENWKVCSA